ncbi:hypothetical protein M9434_000327 [Picochlorum sp. BPE23]|nr:hypothetical protein M9434_000327 [Picochlorum sp. BPE23]
MQATVGAAVSNLACCLKYVFVNWSLNIFGWFLRVVPMEEEQQQQHGNTFLDSFLQDGLDFDAGRGDMNLHHVLDLDIPYDALHTEHGSAKGNMGEERAQAPGSTPNGAGVRDIQEKDLSGYNGSAGRIDIKNVAVDAVEGSEVNSGNLGTETGSSGKPGRQAKRQRSAGIGDTKKAGQQMRGRFSGRLPTKEDEKRLADECQLLAPYLSEDGSLCTLATIIRAMAAGSVRTHLEKVAKRNDDMMTKLNLIQSQPGGVNVNTLADSVVSLQNDLAQARAYVRTLEGKLGYHEGMEHGRQQASPWVAKHPSGAVRSNPVEDVLRTLPQTGAEVTMPMHKSASVGVLTSQGAALLPQQATIQVPLVSSSGVVPAVAMQSSHSMGDLNSIKVYHPQQQEQPTQPVMHGSRSAVNLQDQSAFASQSHGLGAQDQRTSISNEMTVGSVDAASGEKVPNANDFVRAASLHGAAKAEAASQAQQLAEEAQKHAQASVRAAQQAEELKRTLSELPESEKGSDQAQNASATVSSLEARAKAHASITTQVIAKARNLHGVAQSHENEEMKAIDQAARLQAQASSLHQGSIDISASMGMERGNDYSQQVRFTNTAGPTVATPTLLGAGQQTQAPFGKVDVVDDTVTNASDGLPNTALHLGNTAAVSLSEQQQQHVALAQIILQQKQAQMLNPSHIMYTNAQDPSADAAALQQQIAALHAQQPASLVSAPPIQIQDHEEIDTKDLRTQGNDANRENGT